MDALVFEFMGLAMLALCVVVMAVPSGAGLRGARATTDDLNGRFDRRQVEPRPE